MASFRWRIALPFIGLILLVALLSGLYLSAQMRQAFLADLQTRLLAEAGLAADAIGPQMDANAGADAAPGFDAAAQRWAELAGARFTIIAADGQVIGESHENSAEMDNHLDRPEIRQAAQTGLGVSTRYSQTAGYQMMYLAVPVENSGQTLGYMRVARPLAEIEAHLKNLRNTILGGALLAGLAAVGISYWLSGLVTRPLRQLTQAAGELAHSEINPTHPANKITYNSIDEIGQLTRAFNEMAGQLNARILALNTEQGKLRSVLEAMGDGVLIVDAQGLVQLINPAAAAMFSVSMSDPIGRSLVEVIRQHQLVELWQASARSGQVQSAPVEMGARRMYLYILASPLGQLLAGSILILIQDLTRLRRLETVRRDFISNISHELRTPLASLKALTETLLDGALDDPPAAQRFLRQIEIEVDALTQMVTELLELARIESGRVPLQLAPIDACALINAAVARLALQAERAKLVIETACPPDLPLILADATRLEQVLVNLLHNAIKFTPAGGRITLRGEARSEHLLLSATDTGIGIPPGDLERIFERFYKSDRARATGGTGLGLAIARHLVEAHGGRIWAENAPGGGSVFYISIPLAT